MSLSPLQMQRSAGRGYPPTAGSALASLFRLAAAMLVGLVLIVASARAQNPPYTVSPADSARQAQDSILYAARRSIASDSTRVEDYQKIIVIDKARKHFEDELLLAQTARNRNPDSAVAHFLYGDAWLDNSAPDKAIEPLLNALRLAPHFVRARTTIAEAYTMLKSYDTALLHLDSAIISNPRYAQAYQQRASLLSQLGRDSEAVDNYRIVSELLPDSFGPWLKLARGLMKIGNYEEAIDVLRYALSLNATSADALYLFAEANEKAGHTDEAIQAYESFMLRFPTDQRALDAERTARAMGKRP